MNNCLSRWIYITIMYPDNQVENSSNFKWSTLQNESFVRYNGTTRFRKKSKFACKTKKKAHTIELQFVMNFFNLIFVYSLQLSQLSYSNVLCKQLVPLHASLLVQWFFFIREYHIYYHLWNLLQPSVRTLIKRKKSIQSRRRSVPHSLFQYS